MFNYIGCFFSNEEWLTSLDSRNTFLFFYMICDVCSWPAICWHSNKVIINFGLCVFMLFKKAFPRKWGRTNPPGQLDFSSESVSVMTSQATVGRVPGMASDQQTFWCQQGSSGLGQSSNGQVTSFFLLPGMSAAGGVTGRMARCQKQPFRRVKKQAQLGEAVQRPWQREDWGYSTDCCPINMRAKQHCVMCWNTWEGSWLWEKLI